MYNGKEKIELKKIFRNSGKVDFAFLSTDGLTQFFSDQPFWIEYPESVDDVPDSILAVPFVCNVLPIVWLTNAELIIPELDEDFYNCIPQIKKGYVDMYPDATFEGKITTKCIKRNTPKQVGRSAAFFSGGLDAWCTLARHIGEKPDLITIWGADIQADNNEGWNILQNNLKNTAEKLGLDLITIKSSFRAFIDESNLDKAFLDILHDGWWHGAQHGIGLIGHAAPCNYIRGVSNQYIAASFSPEDGNITCASWPTIDNNVRFAGCRVFHDAFINRQEKIKILVNYCKESRNKAELHVCWKTATGENCCKCEKCCRTIIGLLVEGADPCEYGFKADRVDYQYISEYIRYFQHFDQVSKAYWKQIQAAYWNNHTNLDQSVLQKIKWIEKLDVDHPENKKPPLNVRLKHAKGYRGKIAEFKFYQLLHYIKVKLKTER